MAPTPSRLRPTIVALALLAFAPPIAALARPAEDDAPRYDCREDGKEAYRQTRECYEAYQANPDLIYVSKFIEEDEVAAGMDWIPCEDCPDAEILARAKAEFEAEKEKRRAWLAERRAAIDAKTRYQVMHCETTHFTLSFDIEKIKVGRIPYRQLDAMLLYAKRLEEFTDQLQARLGLEEHDFIGTRHHVFITERERSAGAVAPEYTLGQTFGGQHVFRIGIDRSALVFWDDPGKVLDDEHRHQFLIHEISHHLHNDIGEFQWWLFNDHGWLFEGLAFFHEMEMFGPPKVYCGQEGTGTFSHWAGRYWEVAVLGALGRSGDDGVVSFAEIASKSVNDLTLRDRVFAWSYVDFLMWYDPLKMKQVLSRLKGGGSQIAMRDVLLDVYGMTMGQMQDQWLQFVRDHYSPRPKKGPIERGQRTGK